MNNRYFLGLTLSATCNPRVKCPWGGARGQSLEHLRFFFFRFFLLLIFFDGINFDFDGMEFVFEQQVIFRVDSLFDLRPHGLVPPGWGKGSKSRTS